MPQSKPLTTEFIPPCIPTRALKPPSGHDWVHEIKHDGYRLQVRREGDAVRLFTRRGYDWTDRYPAMAATAGMIRLSRARSFALDGEAVRTSADGVATTGVPRALPTIDDMKFTSEPVDMTASQAMGETKGSHARCRPIPAPQTRTHGVLEGRTAISRLNGLCTTRSPSRLDTAPRNA
jgi:bifunctional non-homologous end joining protein LigD